MDSKRGWRESEGEGSLFSPLRNCSFFLNIFFSLFPPPPLSPFPFHSLFSLSVFLSSSSSSSSRPDPVPVPLHVVVRQPHALLPRQRLLRERTHRAAAAGPGAQHGLPCRHAADVARGRDGRVPHRGQGDGVDEPRERVVGVVVGVLAVFGAVVVVAAAVARGVARALAVALGARDAGPAVADSRLGVFLFFLFVVLAAAPVFVVVGVGGAPAARALPREAPRGRVRARAAAL